MESSRMMDNASSNSPDKSVESEDDAAATITSPDPAQHEFPLSYFLMMYFLLTIDSPIQELMTTRSERPDVYGSPLEESAESAGGGARPKRVRSENTGIARGAEKVGKGERGKSVVISPKKRGYNREPSTSPLDGASPEKRVHGSGQSSSYLTFHKESDIELKPGQTPLKPSTLAAKQPDIVSKSQMARLPTGYVSTKQSVCITASGNAWNDRLSKPTPPVTAEKEHTSNHTTIKCKRGISTKSSYPEVHDLPDDSCRRKSGESADTAVWSGIMSPEFAEFIGSMSMAQQVNKSTIKRGPQNASSGHAGYTQPGSDQAVHQWKTLGDIIDDTIVKELCKGDDESGNSDVVNSEPGDAPGDLSANINNVNENVGGDTPSSAGHAFQKSFSDEIARSEDVVNGDVVNVQHQDSGSHDDVVIATDNSLDAHVKEEDLDISHQVIDNCESCIRKASTIEH